MSWSIVIIGALKGFTDNSIVQITYGLALVGGTFF